MSSRPHPLYAAHLRATIHPSSPSNVNYSLAPLHHHSHHTLRLTFHSSLFLSHILYISSSSSASPAIPSGALTIFLVFIFFFSALSRLCPLRWLVFSGLSLVPPKRSKRASPRVLCAGGALLSTQKGTSVAIPRSGIPNGFRWVTTAISRTISIFQCDAYTYAQPASSTLCPLLAALGVLHL